MFFYFIGGSLGSLIGTLMWQNYGWSGVTLTGIGFQLFALFFHFMLFAPKRNEAKKPECYHKHSGFLIFIL